MRLTLKTKLGATFAVIVAMSGISMFVAVQNLGNLNDQIEGIVNGNAARNDLAATINARTLRIARDEKNYILADTPAEFERFGGRIATEEKALRGFVLQMLEKWPWRASKRARSHKGNERGQTPEHFAHGPHAGNASDPPMRQRLAGSQRLKQCSGKRANILRMGRI